MSYWGHYETFKLLFSDLYLLITCICSRALCGFLSFRCLLYRYVQLHFCPDPLLNQGVICAENTSVKFFHAYVALSIAFRPHTTFTVDLVLISCNELILALKWRRKKKKWRKGEEDGRGRGGKKKKQIRDARKEQARAVQIFSSMTWILSLCSKLGSVPIKINSSLKKTKKRQR